MSTTISKESAEKFLEYTSGGILEIKVNKGTKSIFIGEDTMSYIPEMEVLFGNGKKLYIEKIEIINKEQTKIIAQMK
jgi:hypothetical protein